MKTIIITAIILIASVCYADPNMVSITLTMPQEDFDTMISYVTYYRPIPQEEDPNTFEMADVYEPIEYIKYLLVQYLDKLEIRGRKRKGGDVEIKARDATKVQQIKALNVKRKFKQE